MAGWTARSAALGDSGEVAIQPVSAPPSHSQMGWRMRVLGRPSAPVVATVHHTIRCQSERFHSSLIDQQLDAQRIERLERAGLVVVEVTDVQVWHRPREVFEALRDGRSRAALRAREAR